MSKTCKMFRGVWLTLSVLVSMSVCGYAAGQESGDDAVAKAVSDIARVLDYAEMEPAARLKLARAARAAVTTQRPEDALLNSKSCYAVAYALYLNAQAVAETLNTCFYPELSKDDPSQFAIMSSLRAWMWLVNGDSKKSVRAYEEVISKNWEQVEQVTRLRVDVSYATALYQDGQALASIERFQLGLIKALELEVHPVVVASGNNLVVILIERGMYQAAQAWYERLLSSVAQSPRSHYTDSLALHGLQLQGELEDPAAAAKALQEFIDTRADAVPNIVGNAYEFMANFLTRTGRYDDALVAARKAVETLAGAPLELADARLTLAEVLIERGDFADALMELEKTDALTGRSSPNIERGLALSVKAKLGELGTPASGALAEFYEFDKLRGRREHERIEQNTRFFDSMREIQAQQAELQRYELDRIRLESAAATSAVVASEQRTLAEAERRARRLSIAVLALIAGAGVFVMVAQNRRRTDRELQHQAEQMNARLQGEVEEKSVALRKQLGDQAALERSLAETRHNEVIGRITGNVAHDFNNLLQIISLSTERLSAKHTNDEDSSLFAGTRAALQHARSIIRQLLAYARRQKLRPAALRFGEYLAETEALFRVAVDDRIEFTVSDTSGDASIVIDSSQFTTILLNLLSNACDAMPNGGKLSLNARFQTLAGGAAPWTNLASGDYLMIEVKDNGIGMNERTLRRAFEPFFTDRVSGQGTGLGLSSVYGFVKQSRGEVRIDSKEGAGTSIIMVFPATGDLQPDATANGPDVIEVRGRRFLIVEDNQALGRALSIMFEARGANIDIATSAEGARDVLAQDAQFDLVLSDVRMKGEHDGYELRDWIGQKFPRLPVLLMTGFTDDARGGSSVPLIQKPFTEHELLIAMQSVLTLEAAVHR